MRARAHRLVCLVVWMQKSVKTDVTREYRDRGSPWKQGREMRARRVTRGNGPDVGADDDDVGCARAKGFSTIFYNSLRGDICPLILED